MDKKIKLVFYGGVGATTGANIMAKVGQRAILVDCGLLQGGREEEGINFEPFRYDPHIADFLIVTHAHMDHIGRIPKLVREGFEGKIFSTIATRELAEPMLLDAIGVMKSRHPGKTLFDEQDVSKALSIWEGVSYQNKTELFPGLSFELLNAGHILGSAIVILKTAGGESVAFTGDLGNSPSPLLPDSDFPKGVNCLVMESVYGDRNHESKKERREKLKNAIKSGINRKGTIVIPAFSIERTQVLLYEINNMIEDGELPRVPVFLDSPLARKVTDIYKKYKNDFKESVKEEIKSGDDIFDFPGLRIIKEFMESEIIDRTPGPKIIIAGSGMSEGGRVLNHELRILNRAENTLILVGYQSAGTLGRHLEDGAKEVSINGEEVKVRAKIEVIKGYSSHMDSEHLLEFVEKVSQSEISDEKKLKQVFVIMGEPKSSLFLAQRIREYLDIEAVYPKEGKEYEL